MAGESEYLIRIKALVDAGDLDGATNVLKEMRDVQREIKLGKLIDQEDAEGALRFLEQIKREQKDTGETSEDLRRHLTSAGVGFTHLGQEALKGEIGVTTFARSLTHIAQILPTWGTVVVGALVGAAIAYKKLSESTGEGEKALSKLSKTTEDAKQSLEDIRQSFEDLKTAEKEEEGVAEREIGIQKTRIDTAKELAKAQRDLARIRVQASTMSEEDKSKALTALAVSGTQQDAEFRAKELTLDRVKSLEAQSKANMEEVRIANEVSALNDNYRDAIRRRAHAEKEMADLKEQILKDTKAVELAEIGRTPFTQRTQEEKDAIDRLETNRERVRVLRGTKDKEGEIAESVKAEQAAEKVWRDAQKAMRAKLSELNEKELGEVEKRLGIAEQLRTLQETTGLKVTGEKIEGEKRTKDIQDAQKKFLKDQLDKADAEAAREKVTTPEQIAAALAGSAQLRAQAGAAPSESVRGLQLERIKAAEAGLRAPGANVVGALDELTYALESYSHTNNGQMEGFARQVKQLADKVAIDRAKLEKLESRANADR